MGVAGSRTPRDTLTRASRTARAIAGLITTFGLGWLTDRFSDRILIVGTMLLLAAATVGAGFITPGFTAVLYGIALGACGNGIRTLEAVAFPHCFGLQHLGAIRGVVHSVGVGASAFGPLLDALRGEYATSRRPILFALTALPLAVLVAGVLVRTPPPAPPAHEGRGDRAAAGQANCAG